MENEDQYAKHKISIAKQITFGWSTSSIRLQLDKWFLFRMHSKYYTFSRTRSKRKYVEQQKSATFEFTFLVF